MVACRDGHVDTARMLLGEFDANIDNQDTVRATVSLYYVAMCEYVFSGCARGIGGWEDGRCCGYWHIFGFDFVTIVCIMFSLLHHCMWLLMMFYIP